MRYLFIVQGEGRGHMTQAIALAAMLRRNGHEVVEALVGCSRQRKIPDFFYQRIGCRVRRYQSPNFCFGKKKKKVSLAKSILANLTVGRLRKLKKSIELIHRRIEKVKPDAVVNFYEILAGLANLRFREQAPFVSIAHQFLVRHPDFGCGRGSEQGKMWLRLNALLCCIGSAKTLALSFYPLREMPCDRLAVVPPPLRPEVLSLEPVREEFLLVYLLNSGYAEEVKRWHKRHPEQRLHVFWDKKEAPQELHEGRNLTFHRIDDRKFLALMARCRGYVTTAGFESLCEAMYLDKPAMMIPAHIEQQLNAADAERAGAGIASPSFDFDRFLRYLREEKNREGEKAPDETFRAWVGQAEELFVRHLTTLA